MIRAEGFYILKQGKKEIQSHTGKKNSESVFKKIRGSVGTMRLSALLQKPKSFGIQPFLYMEYD